MRLPLSIGRPPLPGQASTEQGSATASSHRHPPARHRASNNVGAILPVVLILVLVFSTLGLGLLRLSSEASVETARTVQRQQSFYAAEAGIHDALARAAIARDQGRQEVFPAGTRFWVGTNDTCAYEVTITNITASAFDPPVYRIRSVGTTPANASSNIELTLAHTNALPVALFAAENLRIRDQLTETVDWLSGSRIGYDGRVHPPLGQARLVSDGWVALSSSPHTGEAGDLHCTDCGFTEAHLGDVDADPLGITEPGPLVDVFDQLSYSPVDLVVFPKTTNTWSAGDTVYMNRVEIQAEGVLEVHLPLFSSDIVSVFLEGSFVTANGGVVRITGGGARHRFRIFARGSTGLIRLRLTKELPSFPTGVFVYAPERQVEVESIEASFSGGLWGRSIDLRVPNDRGLYIHDRLTDDDAFDHLSLTKHFYRLATSEWEHDYHPPP